MSALARTTEINCDTRAANEDCINGGPRTRTKYTYDANGNMTSRLATHPLVWSSANYPTSVGGPGEGTTWKYGPTRQAYRSEQDGPGGNEITFHAGKLYEHVTFGGNSSNYRHYIMAGNELVAIYSRTYLGVNTLNYIQSDHQGSIASITTSTPATNYVNESFTAFGNRRNGETWSGAPTTADETAINGKSRWGYTGQTAIGVNMGLTHLNGRVDDAILGRFLSPDPFIPDPGNTQSFNRYSYAINNPVTRVDPTGFDDCDDCDSSPYGADESNWASGWSQVGQTNSNGTLWATNSNQDNFIGYSFRPDTLVNWQNSGAPGEGPGYWQDYHSETITKLNPDGTDSGEAPDSEELLPLQVLARRSDWVSSAGCGISIDCGFDFAAFGRALAPYNPGLAAAQFLAIGVGGAAFSGGYAAIGAAAGAAGGYKATHTLMGTLMGAGLGSLTGGAAAAVQAPVGLAGVAYTAWAGGVSAFTSTASVNALTGQPVMQNVGYATAIGALAPLATGEAMVMGGAGLAPESAVGYVLNAASNTFSVALGP